MFTAIYSLLIHQKGFLNAVKYGVLFGIGSGVSMGYGSYAAMPISAFIANSWFLGSLFKMMLAGIVLGVIVKD